MTFKHKVPISVHLFLLQGDKVLMLLRKNTTFSNMFGLISGKVDAGESVVQALIRETKEEVDIVIQEKDVEFSVVSHSNANNVEYVQFFFTCDKWSGDIIKKEPDKCERLQWFSLTNLPKNTVPYIAEAIQNYLTGNAYYELNWK